MRQHSTRLRPAWLFLAPPLWGALTYVMTQSGQPYDNLALSVAVAVAMTAGLALGLTARRP